MREVIVGEKTITIVASPITPYIYSREFGPKADLLGDLSSFQAAVDGHPEDARFFVLFKILWAMAKTAKMGAEFPNFEAWLGTVDITFADQAIWKEVIAEAMWGFFRKASPDEAVQER
jgi:hypothetical protein